MSHIRQASKRDNPAGGLAAEGSFAGSNGIGRERIYDIQRARMLAAMVELCSERGAGNVTVAHVVSRSGVSRRTFYELFADGEDCFLAAVDDALTRASECVLEVYEPGARWKDRIRAGLTAVLELLEYDRGVGHIMIVEMLGVGPRALERRDRVLAHVIAAVDEGRLEAKPGNGPPTLTAEGIVGGVLSVLHSRLLACPPPVMGDSRAGKAKHGSMLELTGPLMSMIVLPYLGQAAARNEMRRSPPKRASVKRSIDRNPLRDLDIRLTYRTVRVLIAIATHPRGSNRAIASSAGIEDQGQASKLLSRLQRLGLIANVGAGPLANGAPNAWALTDRGQAIYGAIAEQTSSA